MVLPTGKPDASVRVKLLAFVELPGGGPVTVHPSRPVSKEVLVPSGSVMSSRKTPMPWKAQSLA
jgi:hypothetical protein